MVVTTCSRSSPSWPWSPHRARAECDQRGEEQGLPLPAADRRHERGARAVQGLPGPPGVAPDSQTETFVALRCEIDNWRWAGVPFFLRTGKRMAEGARIISIAFREPPKSMFPAGSGVGAQGPDHLTFDLADASKLSLSFYGKRPGPGMVLDKLSLQFALEETGHELDVLEAYERLKHDAMSGDQTLFTTAEVSSASGRSPRRCSRTRRRSSSTSPARGGRSPCTTSSPPSSGACRSSASGGGAPRCRRHRPPVCGPVNRGRLNAMKLAVLGAGSWGTTVASIAVHNHPTVLWARSAEVAGAINERHESPTTFRLRTAQATRRHRRYGRGRRRCRPDHRRGSDGRVPWDARAAAPFIRPWVPVVSLAKASSRARCCA